MVPHCSLLCQLQFCYVHIHTLAAFLQALILLTWVNSRSEGHALCCAMVKGPQVSPRVRAPTATAWHPVAVTARMPRPCNTGLRQ
jgi:hypothetical protein